MDGNSHRHTSRRHGAQAANIEPIFNLGTTLNMSLKKTTCHWKDKALYQKASHSFLVYYPVWQDREPPQMPSITCFCLIVENKHPYQESLWVSTAGNIQKTSGHGSIQLALGGPSGSGRWARQSPEVNSSLNHSVLLDVHLDTHIHGTNGCWLHWRRQNLVFMNAKLHSKVMVNSLYTRSR